MLKRTLLTVLLLTCLCQAKPSPWSAAEQPGLLQSQFERLTQKIPTDPIELECRRLERLIPIYDPSCPARMERLRTQAPQLKGASRGRYYWVSSVYAGRRKDWKARDEFRRLALAEPAISPAQRALWLESIYREQEGSQPAKFRWVKAELARLQNEQDSNNTIHWAVLSCQWHEAYRAGQNDLARTLGTARIQFADQQGWQGEQMRARLEQSYVQQNFDLWKESLAVVGRCKRSSERDEMLRGLLKYAPDLNQLKQAVALMQHAPSELSLLEAQEHPTRKSGQSMRPLFAREVQIAQRLGLVEEEILARAMLAQELRSAGLIEDALRQQRAALQCRIDRPLVDPSWGRTGYRPGDLASHLALELANHGRYHQSQAVVDAALQAGWAENPQDLYKLRYYGLYAALRTSDEALVGKYWPACLELLPQLPREKRLQEYLMLAESAPRSLKFRQAECYQQARQLSEEILRSDSSDQARRVALECLDSDLIKRRDFAGRLELWKTQLEEATRKGSNLEISRVSNRLLNLYVGQGMLSDLKSLAQARLSSPSLERNERASILRIAPFLAQKSDPLALAWADEMVKWGRQSKQDEQPSLLDALMLRANVLTEFHRYPGALEVLDEANRLAVGPEHRHQRGELNLLRARVLWESNHRPEAIGVLEAQLDDWLASEEPEFLTRFLKTLISYQWEGGADWQRTCENTLSRLEAKGELALDPRNEALFLWLEKLAAEQDWDRGREVLLRHPWRASPTSRFSENLQKFKAWSDLLPAPAETTPSPVEQSSLIPVLDRLRLDQPELGQLLSLRSTNLKQLQSRLGPNETLVTYCISRNELYLLALTASDSFWRKSQVDSYQLKQLIADYLKNLSSETPQTAERSLQSMLIDPVLRDDPNQRLYLVPTGELWQVPFGALRDAKNHSASARADVVLLGSGDLLRMADKSWAPYRLTQPLAIGAPPSADLPGAHQELAEVSQALPDCQLRRGEQATLDVLYDPNQRWGLLHFASHAHYNRGNPLDSDIELQGGNLKLKELSKVSLADRSLVSLSCCQGGDARGQALDEPVTLATGFSAAGAETVVANLWAVEDEVARGFFKAFYQELAAGASPGASFRRAQQVCRQKYPNPRD